MKKNYSFLVVLVYLFFSRANAQTAHPDFHDGLLSFKTLVDSSVSLPLYPYEGTYPYMDSLIAKYGITNIKKTFATSEDPNLSGCFRVQFDSIHLVDSLMLDIKQYGFIEYVSKKPIKRPFATPNDPKYSQQWALKKIVADSIWHLLTGSGKDIILAVIDDAVILNHEEFDGLIDNSGEDFADGDLNVNPLNATDIYFSHGTHVAGIALGRTNNTKGVASLNYNGKIKLLPLKIAQDADPSYFINTDQAIDYAANNGAKVVNLSWGSPSKDLDDSVALANNLNVIFVCSAGNTGSEVFNYPASFNLPNIISVGASNNLDQKPDFSTFNTKISVLAPGAKILNTVASDTNAYNYMSGTSMAAPLVAGLCAALWSYDSTLTTQEVIDRVINTADNIDFENPNFVGKIGAGRINAYRAFNNITSQPHQAGFKVNKKRSLCSGDSIGFSARNYSNVKYIWHFGDGVVDTTLTPNITHTYLNIGVHSVSLVITNLADSILAFNEFSDFISVSNCQVLNGERAQWYFGKGAGIDFRSGRPVVSNAAQKTISVSESSFSFCDSNGNLIFYGGDEHVFNRNHVKMFSHPELNNNPTQGYLPLMFNNKPYLVTAQATGTNGMHYFYLDTIGGIETLSGPFPLTVKGGNIPLMRSGAGATQSDEAIIGIPSCSNGYWLLINGNSQDTNYFNKLIAVKMYDSAGIPKFDFSDAGTLPVVNSNGPVLVKMKASPDGQFIAVANLIFTQTLAGNVGSLSIFRFNRNEGALDSLYWYPIGGERGGICFSPDSRLLYVADDNVGVVYQLDLYDPNPSLTRTTIPVEKAIEDIQIGPDDKLYLSNSADSAIDIISFPNNRNTFDSLNACGFEQAALIVHPDKGRHLPNFIDAKPVVEVPLDFSVQRVGCLGVNFLPVPLCDTLLVWDFGDGNRDTATRPQHVYHTPGMYEVMMLSGNDTIKKAVVVGLIGDIQGNMNICDTIFEYTYSTIKSDFYKYQWSVIGGTIITDPSEHQIRAKFSQAGSLKVLVIDQNTGCVDSTSKSPNFPGQIPNNQITLDSMPCLAFLNGTTLNPLSGKMSYLWQQSLDNVNWVAIDTTEDLTSFINQDSLFFRRIAENGLCSSISNSILVAAKPQITVIHDYRNFICDGDSLQVSNDHFISVKNSQTLPIWLNLYKKQASEMNFTLVDSFLFVKDTLLIHPLQLGDSMFLAYHATCGLITSRTFTVPNGIKANVIELQQQQCFKGGTFEISGTELEAMTPLYYSWQLSLDTLNWFTESVADTLINLQAKYSFGQDTFYIRRMVTDGNCNSTSNLIPIVPIVQITQHPKDVSNCIGFGEAIRTFHLGREFSRWANYKAYLMVYRYVPLYNYLYSAEDSIDFLNPNISLDSIVFMLGHFSKAYFFKIVTPCGDYHSDTARLYSCVDYAQWNVSFGDTINTFEGQDITLIGSYIACDPGPELEDSYTYWEKSVNGVEWISLENINQDTLRFTSSYCDNGHLYRMVYFLPCQGGTKINSPAVRMVVPQTNFADLWMKDFNDDIGVEPNVTTRWEDMDKPTDLWIRHNADGVESNMNIRWPGSNYVYYKIRNRGTDTSKTAKLFIHWTLGGMNGQNWPIAWQDVVGNRFTNMDSTQPSVYLNTYPYGDSVNRVPVMIPPIAPGDSLVGYYEWTDAPNPLRYYSLVGGQPLYDQELSICMLGRIVTCDLDSFGMARKETIRTADNVRNNNNIVLRNTKVINTNGVFGKKSVRLMARNFDGTAPIKLILRQNHICPFMTFGEISLTMNDALWRAWVEGGYLGNGLLVTGSNEVKVTDINAFELNNIHLPSDSIGFVDVVFELDTPLIFNLNCSYYMAQFTGTTIGNDGVFTIFLNVENLPVSFGERSTKEEEINNREREQDGLLIFNLDTEDELKLILEHNQKELQPTRKVATVKAFPNPFSSVVHFELTLPTDAEVSISLINSVGITVKNLANNLYPKGRHVQSFSGGNLPSGIYLASITINGQTKTLKVVLNK